MPKSIWPLLVGLLCVEWGSHAAPLAVDLNVSNRASAYASIAVSKRFAAIAWGATKDSVTDVYLATSTDGGQTFSTPTRVNTVPGEADLSPEQPPRIALLSHPDGKPGIVVVWTAKAPSGTRLFSARSDDAGRSFNRVTLVSGTNAAGNRGWESVATTRDGSVIALWLDHGDAAPKAGSAPMNHAAHQHVTTGENKADGVARAQLSQLFFARIASAESPRAITRGVCYCCKTAMATDSSGNTYAAWRQVYQGNVRDIAFAKSSDGGRTFTAPIRVSEDNWVLDGCPENGPAMAVDRGGRIHVAWPTLVPGAAANSPPTLALFYAMSEDGRHFTPRQRIPAEGVPRHAQITIGSSGQIIVSWDEQSAGKRNIAVARGTIDRQGIARFAREPIVDDSPGSYPIVATIDSATIIGWTSGAPGQTVIRVKHLEQ